MMMWDKLSIVGRVLLGLAAGYFLIAIIEQFKNNPSWAGMAYAKATFWLVALLAIELIFYGGQ